MIRKNLIAVTISLVLFFFTSGILYFNISSSRIKTPKEILKENPVKSSKEAPKIKQGKDELLNALDELEFMHDNLKYEYTKYRDYDYSWANYGIAWENLLEKYVIRYHLNRTLNPGEPYFDAKYNLIMATRNLFALHQQYDLSLMGKKSNPEKFEEQLTENINKVKENLQE